MNDDVRPHLTAMIDGAIALASISPATAAAPILDHCRAHMQWVMPALLRILDGLPGVAPQWHRACQHLDRDALIIDLKNAIKPAPPHLPNLHGWRTAEPLLCALATSMKNVNPDAHGALLAAALVARLTSPRQFNGQRCYCLGLEFRRLAEPLASSLGGDAYEPPEDMDQLDSLDAIIERLPTASDPRGDDERFSGNDGAHNDTLVTLGVLLRAAISQTIQRDRSGTGSTTHGTRGPRGPRLEAGGLIEVFDDLDTCLTSSPADNESGYAQREIASPRTFVRSPIEQEREDENDEDDPDNWATNDDVEQSTADVALWPSGAARLETRLDPQVPANVRRAALADAERPAIGPQEDLDAAEDLSVRSHRMDLGLAHLWWAWDQGDNNPWRRSRLALVLVSVLGVALQKLSQLALLGRRNQTQPGMRISSREGAISGTLHLPLPNLAAPIFQPVCDAQWLHPTGEFIVLPIHPTIARWLADALTGLGAQWASEEESDTSHLLGLPRHLKLRRTVNVMARDLARAYPGMRATPGNLMGMHLAAMAREGTADRGLACLAAPWLSTTVAIQTLYTNVPSALIAQIGLRTQAHAWQMLCGQTLDLNAPGLTLPEGRVGSRRCPIPEAVRQGHAILRDDAQRAMHSPVRTAQAAARRINTMVLLTVFELSASRALRARRDLWRHSSTLSIHSLFWTFADKGRHRRSLPLDGADHAALGRLADAFRDARHPVLNSMVQAELIKAERSLRGEIAGSQSAPMGQLVLKNRVWCWRPVGMMDLYHAWSAHGLYMSPAGLRYAARSVLAEHGHAPQAIDSLLGHHAWGREDFRPLRHASGPWLRDTTMPLIHALRKELLAPKKKTRSP